MPTNVRPLHPEEHRCVFCDTLAVEREDEGHRVLVCPNDNCANVFVRFTYEREPASRRANPLNPERTKAFVLDQVGRAEREASALMAEYAPVTGEKVHPLVALAWGRGFIAGFGSGTEEFAALLDALHNEAKS